ncbi:hypothetical protein M758_3G264200 [Ceratodon purpureus]|nr:hypothetical protein M758_3G264200 [Ceratodon purpureus]
MSMLCHPLNLLRHGCPPPLCPLPHLAVDCLLRNPRQFSWSPYIYDFPELCLEGLEA